MSRRNPNAEGAVELPAGSSRGVPYIDPSVGATTADEAYALGVTARQQAKRKGGLPKSLDPVGGGPSPAVPRLDGQFQKGMTMEQQALAERGAPVTVGPGGIVMPGGTAQLGIMPTDVLPDQAKQDPAFQHGFGSMFAAHQPHLAVKYGVMRGGNYLPPQKLMPPRAQLRPETLQDLQRLENLQQAGPSTPPIGALHATEADAQKGISSAATAAARVGNLPGDDSEKPLTEEERAKLKENIDKLDEFDLDSFRQAMMRDILNNPDQQKAIEARLKPLSIDELIMNNRIEQDVMIIPGKLWYTFQSMGGDDDQAIKRLIMLESKSVEVSDRYLLDKYSFMSITVGLKAINGKPFGAIYDATGNFSDDLFWSKFNRILKLPMQMLASIGVNLFWFEARVRKLFVVDLVGNG